ncbi:tubby-like protein [Chloropicon primus]|uniref:Tubby-like protein n=1 Tax=Chloropicon primus TaxID=1764295 RepID=A0A5B8MFX4_9CHLO|nr:tubby-like protein [Chloropicon primus]UPQ97451.1 tubby-like protein [Chloropicon primus]|eukprot:QDZ18240.1 tubby-like protein [Chloropicon primus]
MSGRDLLGEAAEALQPKFRGNANSSLILEDRGDYHQTLREKYTGKKGVAFRRSLASGTTTVRGLGGYRGYKGSGDDGGLSSDSESDENLSIPDEKSPASSQRTSSSCEDSFVVSPVSEAGVRATLSSPFAPQLSQDNPVFNLRTRSTSHEPSGKHHGGGGRAKITKDQVLNNGSNLYRAGRSLAARTQGSPGIMAPKTPMSSLKAALREEEELVSKEEEKPGLELGSGGKGRGVALADHISQRTPSSMMQGTADHGRAGGTSRKLFQQEGERSDGGDGEKVLARPKEASEQSKPGLGADVGRRGLDMGMASTEGIMSLLNESRLEALLRPLEMKKMLQCRMIRKRGIVGSYPVFEMLLDNVPGLPDSKAFLLCARKRKKSKSSYYIISVKREGLTRESEGYIAKLRGNILGSEYTLFKRSNADKGDAEGGDELLAIRYKQTLLTKDGGPRSMTAIFTDPKCAHQAGANTELIHCYKESKERAKSDGVGGQGSGAAKAGSSSFPPQVVLKSLEPQWREDLQSYVLDFKGRVTEASVKNFVMADSKASKTIAGAKMDDGSSKVGKTVRAVLPSKKEVVIFGKRGKNEFSLDVAAPCSILQAFAMAIASTDFKMVNSM